MLRKAIALVASVSFSLPVSAAFTSINSVIQDHGIFTRDLASGLDWLDLTETLWLSGSEVAAEMGAGGRFDGWEFAKDVEFIQLMVNFGFDLSTEFCGGYPSTTVYSCAYYDLGSDDAVEQAIRTLGDLKYETDVSHYERWGRYSNDDYATQAGKGFAQGWVASQAGEGGPYDTSGYVSLYDREYLKQECVGPPEVCTFGLPGMDSEDVVATWYNPITPPLDSNLFTLGEPMGVFLVRASPVPVPGAVWLFGSALMGLVGLRRRS